MIKYEMSFHIKPIKAPANDVIIHPYLPSHPSLMAIVAPRKSGKTTLLVNMLSRKDMFKNFFHQIHIWSPTLMLDAKWQKITKNLPPEWLHTHFDEQEFSNLMEEIGEMHASIQHLERHNKKVQKQNILFVFDDSASEKGLFSRNFTSPTIQSAFTSRHYNVSMWIVSQAYKAISPGFRNNIYHWIIFDTPNEKELYKMSEELSGPLNSKQFIKLLKEVTAKPYQFLYINFESPSKFDIFRNGFGPSMNLEPYLKMLNEK